MSNAIIPPVAGIALAVAFIVICNIITKMPKEEMGSTKGKEIG